MYMYPFNISLVCMVTCILPLHTHIHKAARNDDSQDCDAPPRSICNRAKFVSTPIRRVRRSSEKITTSGTLIAFSHPSLSIFLPRGLVTPRSATAELHHSANARANPRFSLHRVTFREKSISLRRDSICDIKSISYRKKKYSFASLSK